MKKIFIIIFTFLLQSCGAGNDNQPKPDLRPLTIYNYVIVGNNGNIYSSLNGESWIKANINVIDNFSDVTTSKNFFVTVGESGTIMYSINGLHWESPTYINNLHLKFNRITAHDENKNNFTAVGDYGTADITCEYIGKLIYSCYVTEIGFIIDTNTSLVDIIIDNSGNILTVGNNGLNQTITKTSKIGGYTWSLDNQLSILPDTTYSAFNFESQFFILAKNHIYQTPDMSFQESVTKSNNKNNLYQTTRFRNKFYAITTESTLLYSNDFKDWSLKSTFEFKPNQINNIESKIAIVGNNGNLVFINEYESYQYININNNCCDLNAITFKKRMP